MSESDSENDYESADDEELMYDNKVTKPDDVPQNTHLANANKMSSVEDEKLPLAIDTSEEAQQSSDHRTTEKKPYSADNIKVLGSEPQKDTSTPKTEDNEKMLTQSDSENSETRRGSSGSETHTKRVTLRLEKKIQKKNQAIADSNSSKDEEPKSQEKTSTWGFSSWGSSLLSTAASSVSTFTSQVSQGIGTVLETVETSLGAPPPEDLASILKERRESTQNCEGSTKEPVYAKESVEPNVLVKDDDDIPSTSSLLTGVTSLTKVIENTGSKVLMGGLDTLELIGKKTIGILTEGDPGLRKKRSVFSEGVNLSQLLREAKEKAEEQANTSLDNQEEVVYFSTFFDEFQGLIHLEALEMLSSQCQTKVQGALMMTSGDSSTKEDLERIKRICEDLPSADETPDDKTQDFDEALNEHLQSLQLQVNVEKIKKVRNVIHKLLDECIAEQEASETKDYKELYRQAISSLAEFTATCVEQFHKFGELILVQTDPDFSNLLCATHLTGLTTILCVEVGILANGFCQCLNTAADVSEDPDSVTPLITTVFLEASNSTTYIQDAFQLLVPVLQASLLQ